MYKNTSFGAHVSFCKSVPQAWPPNTKFWVGVLCIFFTMIQSSYFYDRSTATSKLVLPSVSTTCISSLVANFPPCMLSTLHLYEASLLSSFHCVHIVII
uniref:Expressed protein n=1 Tax=Echinococcus granulosus TaxID=6210 RepID=A0A068W7B6_ECHGR|nr:expressed protein [Echinococcus granulosus]